MEFNDNQKKAITLEDKNILVSAAAGSGKTKVLVERICNIIVNSKCSIKDMVIMTFTKSATFEMKKRIKDRLYEILNDEKYVDKKEIILKEISLLKNANISTIDAFCKRLIDDNFESLDIDCDYRIADEMEFAILYDEILNDLLEEKYGDSDYDIFFKSYFDKNDIKIKRMLILGLDYINSLEWPIRFIDDSIKNYDKNYEELSNAYFSDIYFDTIDILKDIKSELEFCANDLLDMTLKKDSVENKKKLEAFSIEFKKKYVDTCSELLNALNKEKFYEQLVKIKNIINKKNTYDFRSIQIVSNEKDRTLRVTNSYKRYQEILNNIYQMIDTDAFFKKDIYELHKNNEILYLKLLKSFYLLCEEKKKEKNIISISDPEKLALSLLYEIDENDNLVFSNKARELSDKYKYIFVDEYQDSSKIQEAILCAITNNYKNNNLFMVGDVKQAIYAFRHATPKMFIDKMNEFDRNNVLGETIFLNQNYRSMPHILDYVNDVFKKIMIKNFGDIDYIKDGMLTYEDRKNDDEIDTDKVKTEILILPYDNSKAENVNENLKVTKEKAEGFMIAEKIIELHKKGYAYRDIVILLRKKTNNIENYFDALNLYGIPCFANITKGFFERYEIILVINILKVLENPYDSIAVLSVLCSRVFNFSNDEIAYIRYIYNIHNNINKKEIFIKLLENYINIYETNKNLMSDFENINKDVIYEKIKKFIDTFDKIRVISRYKSISNLIDFLYDELNILDLMASMNDSKNRLANLKLLYDSSLMFEKTKYTGLFNFLRYVEKIKKRDADMDTAKIINENDDVVRIMSIHNAKGLEFKVVIIANLETGYRFDDKKDNIYFNEDYGIALKFVNYEKKYTMPDFKMRCITYYNNNKLRHEELRLLYVAMTRSREKLILTCSHTIKRKKTDSKDDSINDEIDKILDEFQLENNISRKDLVTVSKFIDIIKMTYSSKMENENNVVLTVTNNEYYDKLLKKYDKENIFIEDISDLEVKYKDYVFSEGDLDNIKFKYKFDDLTNIKTKFSVSEIKEEHIEENKNSLLKVNIKEDEYDELEEKQLNLDIKDRTRKGVLYHRFMYLYNYNSNIDINTQLDNMIKDKLLCDEDERDLIDVHKLKIFFDSDLGNKMKNASINNMLYREKKFMKLFSKKELDDYIDLNKMLMLKNKNLNPKFIVQGIIDAFFIDHNVKDEKGNPTICLIDYKTDKVKNKKELISRYEIQLNIYAKALEDITSMMVSSKIIYSFEFNEIILI